MVVDFILALFYIVLDLHKNFLLFLGPWLWQIPLVHLCYFNVRRRAIMELSMLHVLYWVQAIVYDDLDWLRSFSFRTEVRPRWLLTDVDFQLLWFFIPMTFLEDFLCLFCRILQLNHRQHYTWFWMLGDQIARRAVRRQIFSMLRIIGCFAVNNLSWCNFVNDCLLTTSISIILGQIPVLEINQMLILEKLFFWSVMLISFQMLWFKNTQDIRVFMLQIIIPRKFLIQWLFRRAILILSI